MKRIPPPGKCVIVGSGPSLNGFDYESLRGQFVIAINNAAKRVPFADVVFFGNEEWFRRNELLVLSHPGEKHRVRFGACAPPLNIPGMIEWLASGRLDVDLTPGRIRTGRTCGYASVNLALHLGATHITLLGMDCQPGGDYARTPYKVKSTPAETWQHLVHPLARLGVSVVNASAISVIRGFPRAKRNPATFVDCGAA